MTLSDTRDLAIKLFGLYCAARAVQYFPQMLSVFSLSGQDSGLVQNTLVVILSISGPAILYAVLAWACLLKTTRVLALLWSRDPDPVGAPSPVCGPTTLSFWITIIGLFYLVRSTAGLISATWIYGVDQQMFASSYIAAQFLPDVFLFPLSIICILKAKRIETFISRDKVTQQETGECLL